MTARSLLGKLYRTSLADAVAEARTLVEGRLDSSAQTTPLTLEFLRSAEYEELMTRHLPCDGSYDLHEAQNITVNFRFRHLEVPNRLGVFRWRGLHRNKERVLGLLASASGRVLDFGGAGGPLGLNSVVVDQLERDALGRSVELRSLESARGTAGVVFTSHALEHVPPLDEVLQQIHDSLVPGGAFVAHLPSYFCERWRAGLHTNKEFNDHVWTFGLEDDPQAKGLHSYINIAKRVAKLFSIELAEYCGDDSILIIARRA